MEKLLEGIFIQTQGTLDYLLPLPFMFLVDPGDILSDLKSSLRSQELTPEIDGMLDVLEQSILARKVYGKLMKRCGSLPPRGFITSMLDQAREDVEFLQAQTMRSEERIPIYFHRT